MINKHKNQKSRMRNGSDETDRLLRLSKGVKEGLTVQVTSERTAEGGVGEKHSR